MFKSTTVAWLLVLGATVSLGIYVLRRINHHAEILQDSEEEK